MFFFSPLNFKFVKFSIVTCVSPKKKLNKCVLKIPEFYLWGLLTAISLLISLYVKE